MRYAIFLILLASCLIADSKTQTNRELIATPPSEALRKGYKVIKRVYRVIDTNTTIVQKDRQPKNFFIGAGAGFNLVERSVVIDSQNTKDIINLNGRNVVADGSSYSMTQTKRFFVPSVEIGVNKSDVIFYGTKLGIYKEFMELSFFGGARLEKVVLFGFTPLIQVQSGIGYKKIKGASPDNLNVAIIGGAEKLIKDDYLSIGVFVSYKHRYWQKTKLNYGTEYWRDNEIGANIAIRYLF